jgi:hypothetical protein
MSTIFDTQRNGRFPPMVIDTSALLAIVQSGDMQ